MVVGRRVQRLLVGRLKGMVGVEIAFRRVGVLERERMRRRKVVVCFRNSGAVDIVEVVVVGFGSSSHERRQFLDSILRTPSERCKFEIFLGRERKIMK